MMTKRSPYYLHTLLLGLWLMLCGQVALAASLTASVDKDILRLDETLVLTLRYDGNTNQQPDLEVLRREFDVLRIQPSNFTSIINDNIQIFSQWQILLAPKKIGKALIPSFNLGGVISDAIEITVQGKRQGTDIQVETLVDKTSAHVQEQILVSVRLSVEAGTRIYGGDVEPLQVKDALLIQLDEKKYRSDNNGRLVDIVETRYVLFPQQTGELVIPSLLFQLDTGRGNYNLLRLRTEERRLHINPIPQDPRAQPWLPAKNIQLSEHWSSSPDALKVGEPITRSITIKADGLSAAQLPPLPALAIKDLSSYQDQAQTDDQKMEQGIVGSRIETTAIVANRSGTFTLPEIQLHWWDSDEQQFKTATLAASQIKVSGTNPEQDDQPESSGEPIPLNTELPSPTASTAAEAAPWWLYLLLALSLVTNLLLGALLWRQRGKNTTQPNTAKSAQEHNEKEAWRELREVIANSQGGGQLHTLRRTLLEWGKIFWQDPQLASLEQLGQKFASSELLHELQLIDSSIYGRTREQPDLEQLKQLLANLRQATQHKEQETLKKLYPE